MTLLLPQIEELEALLLRLPRLVDAVEREGAQAQAEVRNWLVEIEGAFERNRMASAAAAVAALRAELQMIALGASSPALALAGETRPRRAREVGTLDVLNRAERAVAQALASTLTSHEEAEKLMRQLLAIARHKGVLDGEAAIPKDEVGLRRLWAAVCSDPDLATGSVRVLGLVGEADALALFDRELGAA